MFSWFYTQITPPHYARFFSFSIIFSLLFFCFLKLQIVFLRFLITYFARLF